MHTLLLGGKPFVIKEPVFRDLKVILAALNRLNSPDKSDFNLIIDIQLILVSLIGERHVKSFRRFWWEAWKIPPPSPEELTAMLAVIPTICGLQARSQNLDLKVQTKGLDSTGSDSADWDALYWQIIRTTGWTWEVVDTTMTLSRLTTMQEYLNASPLVDTLVAAYLGYEYSKPRSLEQDIDLYLANNPRMH
jgi:hypothetical protein